MGSQAAGISMVVVVATVLFMFLTIAFVFFIYVFFKYQWGSGSAAAPARFQPDFAPADRDSVLAPQTGLDLAILRSLPVYINKAEDDSKGMMECAVCLSEVVDGEKVRLLPKCNHGFHLGCIDVWFHSHSTCPLCRNPVERVTLDSSSSSSSSSSASASANTTKSEGELVIDIPNGLTEEETKSPMMTRLKSLKRLFSRGNSSCSPRGDNN